MKDHEEAVINRALKIKIPGVAGETQEAIVRGIYDELKKDIAMIVNGL